jgi:hypothetical protein
MASRALRACVAAAALALLFAFASAQPPAKEGDWTTGRATFFSAPAEFKQARARARARARACVAASTGPHQRIIGEKKTRRSRL